MWRKWEQCCRIFGFSLFSPTQTDAVAYIAWLGTEASWMKHDDSPGKPMKYESIVDYVQLAARTIDAQHQSTNATNVINAFKTKQTGFALLATKRILGNTRTHARAITVEEIRLINRLARNVDPVATQTLIVVNLVAFYGGKRMGSILPHNGANASRLSRILRDADLTLLPDRVNVASHLSKTNVFAERIHTISIAKCADTDLCLHSQLSKLRTMRSTAALPNYRNRPLAEIRRSEHLTFERFVAVTQAIIRERPATPAERGKLTGQSWRRGFVACALQQGFTIEQIMLHGEWRHPDSVLRHYAVGNPLPSIPLARYIGTRTTINGSAVFVRPSPL